MVYFWSLCNLKVEITKKTLIQWYTFQLLSWYTFRLLSTGDDKVTDKNLQRKKLAIVEWCKKINQLDEANRMSREWEYVLLSETSFYGLSKNGATIEDICALNKVSMSDANGLLFQ